MEGYLTYYYEYHFLYITGIEHVESQSIQGAALLKLQFHPGTDMSQAMSETVAYVNRARSFMPPGTVPPFVMRFDAGSVPVGDLVFSSQTRTVGEMQDLALNRVRPLFATLPGVSAPPPFGGSARSILINVKPERLRALNMSPDEIVSAITAANLISPSGQHAHRRQVSHGAVEFGGEEHQGPGERAHPHGRLSDGLCARCRDRGGRLGHRDQLCPGERPAHGLYPGDQARRCLHAVGGQPGQAEPGRSSRACCRRT